MKKSIYFCIALLLCVSLGSCGDELPNVTENSTVGTPAVTVQFETEATLRPLEPIADITAETTAVSTAASTAVTTVSTTTSPKEDKFMPTVLEGDYAYNDGSDPVIACVSGVTYVNGVLIANKTYSLPEDFVPGELHPDAKAAFDKMQAAAAAEGITLKIISGYRSYAKQNSLYTNYVNRDGKEAADRYSARPGHSEHQTGLAMDINSLEQSFADTAEGKWLAEHCAEYGFIIRYTKDKEAETGFMYEPWHIRYLGVELAKAVSESGLCLEEYLGITSVYAD